MDLLEDHEADVRACAAFSLGEVRAESAVAALARHLGDSSVYVSAMAADADPAVRSPAPHELAIDGYFPLPAALTLSSNSLATGISL